MPLQIAGSIVFLHGSYRTSTERALRHHVRPVGPSFCGYYASRQFADLQAIGVALCGATGRERLGEQVPNVQASLQVAFQLAAAWAADAAAGDKSAFMHVYIAVMESVALYFQVRKQGIRCFVSVSCFLMGLGAALYPIAPKPGFLLLSIGIPWFIAGAGTVAFRRLTARAARRAVEGDRTTYDEEWRLVMEGPANRAGQVEIEALVAGLRAADRATVAETGMDREAAAPAGGAGGGDAGGAAGAGAGAGMHRRICGIGDGWEWERAGRGAPRQTLPRRSGDSRRGWRLMQREGYELMADMEALYQQAHAAARPLRRLVLRVAAACGGRLRVRAGDGADWRP